MTGISHSCRVNTALNEGSTSRFASLAQSCAVVRNDEETGGCSKGPDEDGVSNGPPRLDEGGSNHTRPIRLLLGQTPPQRKTATRQVKGTQPGYLWVSPLPLCMLHLTKEATCHIRRDFLTTPYSSGSRSPNPYIDIKDASVNVPPRKLSALTAAHAFSAQQFMSG